MVLAPVFLLAYKVHKALKEPQAPRELRVLKEPRAAKVLLVLLESLLLATTMKSMLAK
jgi:hypothetical protein